MRRWLVIVLLLLIVIPLLSVTAWIWAALRISYSSGERIGYVQKLSNKGWVCKTWEGELAMPTQPGVVPQVFPFSVRDDIVARRLHETNGQRVRLAYEQHRFLPTTCFGETEYFITGVQPVGENK